MECGWDRFEGAKSQAERLAGGCRRCACIERVRPREGVGIVRRKSKDVPNAKNRAIVYSCALIALGAYAIPRLPRLEHGLPGTFSMIWILFALLAFSANIYFMVGADKERSRMLESHEISAKQRGALADHRKMRQKASR